MDEGDRFRLAGPDLDPACPVQRPAVPLPSKSVTLNGTALPGLVCSPIGAAEPVTAIDYNLNRGCKVPGTSGLDDRADR